MSTNVDNAEARGKKLEQLRKPFPKEVVGKLPRGIQGGAPKSHCRVCGGWHGPAAVHLDYVGHAEVTDRLLTTDPEWSWEPLARDDKGLPVFERDGQGRPIGFWIRLTILGITRYGYGSVEASKPEAVKELIGDSIRNAAMRFGVALDLWAKSELESQIEEAGTSSPRGQAAAKAADVPPPHKEPEGQSPQVQPAPSGSTSSSWQRISAAVTSPHSKIDKNRVLHITVSVLMKRDAIPKDGLRYDHVANLPEDVLQEVANKLGLTRKRWLPNETTPTLQSGASGASSRLRASGCILYLPSLRMHLSLVL